MPYFAEIDENKKVVRVIVADSLDWCEANLGGEWVETKDDKTESYGNPNTYFVEGAKEKFVRAYDDKMPADAYAIGETVIVGGEVKVIGDDLLPQKETAKPR